MPLYSERRAVSPHGGADLLVAQENRALRATSGPYQKKRLSGGPKFNARWSCGSAGMYSTRFGDLENALLSEQQRALRAERARDALQERTDQLEAALASAKRKSPQVVRHHQHSFIFRCG